ncbi:MAG: aminotransferase class V-fold PLP-dependent enzyme [Eubacteriales bacterium]|nr:aminotransferase class V-fold PLP-dependent enzyme [Eubacteriales bacterium]
MQSIYLDNAATSFPKAPGVAAEMTRYLCEIGGNIGRSGLGPDSGADMAALTLREELCAGFGMAEPECCFLTPGATFGLNQALKGLLKPGDHVLVSSMEHNAVMRPLHQIQGLQLEKVPCAPDGTMDPRDVAVRLRPHTRAVCMTHASNVCGTLLPVADIGAICAQNGVPFVLDASQTAGHIPVDGGALHADAIAFPAHKGLLGPQGIGALLTTRAFAHRLEPLVSGGTGSRSESEFPPSDLPDRFEAGTANIPGVYGFLAALRYTLPRMEAIHAHDMALCERFLDGLQTIRGVRLLGTRNPRRRVAVISVVFQTVDNAEAARRLQYDDHILTRCGLHCAPSAHQTLGSFPGGAVRFSFGWSNTQEDVDQALDAIGRVACQPPN